jgi:hypothetical protein
MAAAEAVEQPGHRRSVIGDSEQKTPAYPLAKNPTRSGLGQPSLQAWVGRGLEFGNPRPRPEQPGPPTRAGCKTRDFPYG